MSAQATASSSPSVVKRTRSRSSARSGVEDDGPWALTTVASHGRSRSRRRSARRKTRSAWRSSTSTNAIRTGASGARCTCAGGVPVPGGAIS